MDTISNRKLPGVGDGQDIVLGDVARNTTGTILDEVEKMLGEKIDPNSNDFNKDELREKLDDFFSDTLDAGDEQTKALHDAMNQETVSKIIQDFGKEQYEQAVEEATQNEAQAKLAALANLAQSGDLFNPKAHQSNNPQRKKINDEKPTENQTGAEPTPTEKLPPKVEKTNKPESRQREELNTTEDDKTTKESDEEDTTEDSSPGGSAKNKKTENKPDLQKPNKAPAANTQSEQPTNSTSSPQLKQAATEPGTPTQNADETPHQSTPKKNTGNPEDTKEEWYDSDEDEKDKKKPGNSTGEGASAPPLATEVPETNGENAPQTSEQETPSGNQVPAPETDTKAKPPHSPDTAQPVAPPEEQGPYFDENDEKLGAPLFPKSAEKKETTPDAQNAPQAPPENEATNRENNEQWWAREMQISKQKQKGEVIGVQDGQLRKLKAELQELKKKVEQLTPAGSWKYIQGARISNDVLSVVDEGLFSSFIGAGLSIYQVSRYFKSQKYLKEYLKKKSKAFVMISVLECIPILNMLPLNSLFGLSLRHGLANELGAAQHEVKKKEEEIRVLELSMTNLARS